MATLPAQAQDPAAGVPANLFVRGRQTGGPFTDFPSQRVARGEGLIAPEEFAEILAAPQQAPVPELAFAQVLAMDAAGNEVVTNTVDVLPRLASGEWKLPAGARVPVVAPTGSLGTVPGEKYLDAVLAGYGPATAQQASLHSELVAASREKLHTFFDGFASGTSLGIVPGIGEDREVLIRKMANPGMATAGEVTALLVPVLGPAKGVGKILRLVTPAGQAARIGPAITRMGRGPASRILASAAGQGLEAGVMSAGLEIGQARLEGEDIEGIASRALSAGLHGGALGGAFGGAFGILGEGVRAIAGRTVEPAIARTLLDETRTALADLDDLTRLRGVAGKKAASADDVMGVLQKEVDGLAAQGASPTRIAELQESLRVVQDAIGKDRSILRRAQRSAARQWEKGAGRVKEAQAKAATNAADLILLTRKAGDEVAQAADMVLGSGVKLRSATTDAYKAFLKAQETFDDLFAKAGRHEPEDIANVLRGSTDKASAAVATYEKTGAQFIQALKREGLIPAELVPEQIRRLRDAFPNPTRALEDIAAHLVMNPRATAPRPSAAAAKTAKEAQVAGGRVIQNLARAEELRGDIARLRNSRRRLAVSQEKLARAQATAQKARAQVDEIDSLIAQKAELKPLVDELQGLVERGGLKITSVDVAAAAIELGVSGNPELEWLARAHLLLRAFTGRGLVGGDGSALGRFIPGAVRAGGRRLGIEAIRRVLPLRSGMFQQFLLGAGGNVSARLLGEATEGFLGRARQASARSGQPLTVGFREEFERRSRKALSRLDRFAKSPLRAITPAVAVLSRVRFAPMKHEPAAQGTPRLHREFERRAAELESLMGARESTVTQITAALADDTDLDEAKQGLVAETMFGALEFLYQKLPPPNSAGSLYAHGRNNTASEIEKWSQYVRYTMDPPSVLEDYADGTLTPEGPEALAATAPMLFARVQEQLIDKVTAANSRLPYAVRVSMSTMWNIPADAAADIDLGVSLTQMHAKQRQEQQGGARPPARQTMRGNAPTDAQRLEAK